VSDRLWRVANIVAFTVGLALGALIGHYWFGGTP